MKVLPVFMLLTLVASGLCQDLNKEIAACAAIENSVERLAAYDLLAQRIGVAKTTKIAINGAAKWAMKTETSPLDDKAILILSLVSEEPVKAGYKTGHPVSFIRYKEGRLECFINYGFFLGTTTTLVTTRLDKNEPKTHDWDVSSDHKAIFYPSGVNWFVKSMANSTSLIVRLTPYGESPVTTSFDLTGLAQAIEPIFSLMQSQ
jgi:type VI secretion system protein VasI